MLPYVLDAAIDVSTNIVRVILLQFDRVEYVACQYEIAEARREAFDLRLYVLRHVEGRPTGDVAVGPKRVLPLWRSRCIEKAWLREHHKGPLGVLAFPYRAFGGGDFWQRATQVDSSGACTSSGLPGDRAIEREVDLEYTGAVAIALEPLLIPARQVISRDAQQLPGRHIEQDGARFG